MSTLAAVPELHLWWAPRNRTSVAPALLALDEEVRVNKWLIGNLQIPGPKCKWSESPRGKRGWGRSRGLEWSGKVALELEGKGPSGQDESE